MRLASRFHEPAIAARKRRLLGRLRGRVLEIGPGHGVNLPYYGEGVEWVGFEPNEFLARDVVLPVGGILLGGRFESYDLEANSADAVVCTLVLCSVDDPAAVLARVHRVLKPGGVLVFVEHVAAPDQSDLRRSQETWLPIWRCCAGGCHPNRDTQSAIAQSGLRLEECEAFHLPMWLASPHIAGVARKAP